MPFKDLEVRRAYDRDRKQAWYDDLTAFEFNQLMLKRRRTRALARLRQLNKED